MASRTRAGRRQCGPKDRAPREGRTEPKDEAHHAFLPHLALAACRASALRSSSLIAELLELFQCHDLCREQRGETPPTIVTFGAKNSEIAGDVHVAAFLAMCVKKPRRPPVA